MSDLTQNCKNLESVDNESIQVFPLNYLFDEGILLSMTIDEKREQEYQAMLRTSGKYLLLPDTLREAVQFTKSVAKLRMKLDKHRGCEDALGQLPVDTYQAYGLLVHYCFEGRDYITFPLLCEDCRKKLYEWLDGFKTELIEMKDETEFNRSPKS